MKTLTNAKSQVLVSMELRATIFMEDTIARVFQVTTDRIVIWWEIYYKCVVEGLL